MNAVGHTRKDDGQHRCETVNVYETFGQHNNIISNYRFIIYTLNRARLYNNIYYNISVHFAR